MRILLDIEHWAAAAAVASVGMCVFVVALCAFCAAAKRTIKAMISRMSRTTRMLLGVAAASAILYGGGKRTVFLWDAGLSDNGSYGTNDMLSVAWDYADYLANDTIYIDMRETGSTNKWQRFWSGPVSDGSVFGYVEGATNYTVYAWTAYVPPDTVVTNGVYHISGVMHPMDEANTNAWITPATPIRANGRTLSPHGGIP